VENKEITAATLRNYVKSIKLFCEMSDIPLPWKKITRGFPKSRRYANDRAPTLHEVQKVMEYPDRRITPIVSLMASSGGVRIGAWEYMRWCNIGPIEKDGRVVAAKLNVYAGEEDEYFTFITPEAYQELEKWRKFRANSGEKMTESSWVMRDLWNAKEGYTHGLVSVPKRLRVSGIKSLIEEALWTGGIRRKLEPNTKRHEFQAAHGFRKWFKTRCELAGMKSINIEILMGHSIGISDSYYRATESEVLDDYLKAVDCLTISNENKLQKKVTDLVEKSGTDSRAISMQLEYKDNQIHVLMDKDTINTDAIASLSDQLTKVMKEIETLKTKLR
jgi:integrase